MGSSLCQSTGSFLFLSPHRDAHAATAVEEVITHVARIDCVHVRTTDMIAAAVAVHLKSEWGKTEPGESRVKCRFRKKNISPD